MEYTVIQQERYLQIENGVNYIGGRIRRIFLARIEIETVAAYYTSSFPNVRLYLFNVIKSGEIIFKYIWDKKQAKQNTLNGKKAAKNRYCWQLVNQLRRNVFNLERDIFTTFNCIL